MRDAELQQRAVELRRQETRRMEHEDIFSFMRETHDARELLRKEQRRRELEEFYRPDETAVALAQRATRAQLPDVMASRPAPGAHLSPGKRLARDLLHQRPKGQFSLLDERQAGGTLASEYPFLADFQEPTGFGGGGAAAAPAPVKGKPTKKGGGKKKVGETIYSLPAVGGPPTASYAQLTTSAVYNTKMQTTFVQALGLKADHATLAAEAQRQNVEVAAKRRVPLKRQLIASASEPAIKAAAAAAGAVTAAVVDSRPELSRLPSPYNPRIHPAPPYGDTLSVGLSSLHHSTGPFRHVEDPVAAGRAAAAVPRAATADAEDEEGPEARLQRLLAEMDAEMKAVDRAGTAAAAASVAVATGATDLPVLSEEELAHDWALDEEDEEAVAARLASMRVDNDNDDDNGDGVASPLADDDDYYASGVSPARSPSVHPGAAAAAAGAAGSSPARLETVHRLRHLLDVSRAEAVGAFLKKDYSHLTQALLDQTATAGAGGAATAAAGVRTATPPVPVPARTAEKISALLQKNRLDLARTQRSLALASMTAIDPAVALDAHAHSKRPHGITKVRLPSPPPLHTCA